MRNPAILLVLCAATAFAQAPDLTTPEVQKLKTDALTQRAEIVRQRTEGLRKVIETQLDNSRQALAKAKVSGNITATASGTAAVKIFTDVKAAFDKDGTYAVTGKVRSDLESTVEDFKRNLQVVEDRQDTDLKKLNRTFAAKLGEVLAKQKTPVKDEAKLLELWTPLLGAAAAAAATTPAATTPGATAAATSTNAASAVGLPAASQVLQSQGESANWTQLLKIEVTVRDALEVVSFPLPGITATKQFTGVGGMGNEWQITASPFQEFTPGATPPAMRLQSLPPYKPLEVVAWPSARNSWTIELRAKTTSVPSKHVVVLEADAAACKAVAGLVPPSLATPGAASSPTGVRPGGSTVKVRFESTPEGASVFFNGVPVGENGKLLTTPFEITMSVNPVDIAFRKRGYKDLVLPHFFPTPTKPISATLVEDGSGGR
jgi:uncharacterized surface protein with fasciclin (FAS1) repeats